MTPDDDDDIAAIIAGAGLTIPADLRAGVYAEASALRRAAALLRAPRNAAAEPSNVFSLAESSPDAVHDTAA